MRSVLLNEIVKDIKKISEKAGISPSEITKTIYYQYGGKFSEWEIRSVGGLTNIIKAYFVGDENWDLIATSIHTKNKASRVNKYHKTFGNLHEILSRIQQSVSKIPPITPNFKHKEFKKTNSTVNRMVTLVLSDHHIGSDILKEETGFKFSSIEESRALACIAEQVINYKTDKRNETILNVLMLGDIIENELHGASSADFLHLQTCRAIYLYPQLLSILAQSFKKVNVFCSVGNHGRDKFIHPERATSLKFNAIETTIYFAIKQIMSKYPNISFTLPMTPWVEFNLFNHKGYATHGDTHIRVGNPGRSINISRIEQQINKINASLKDTEEYKVFVMGHVHQPMVTQLANGSYLIINGSIVPPNAYAQSINIMESPQVQILWESTMDYPVGDFRLIDISGSENKAKFDKIIKPFSGF